MRGSMLTCVLMTMVGVLGCDGRVQDRSLEAVTGPVKVLDAEMIKWRCQGENVQVDGIGETEEKENVLRFSYPKAAGARRASLSA